MGQHMILLQCHWWKNKEKKIIEEKCTLLSLEKIFSKPSFIVQVV
jgi:hypothetical protein